MDAHTEAIWQRESAGAIMKEARRRFRESGRMAYTAFASAHWSLVKRYEGWRLPLAMWHAFRAVWYARRALSFRPLLSYSGVAVVSPILGKTPWFLGGNKRLALVLAENALFNAWAAPNEAGEIEPVNEALLSIIVGELHLRNGSCEVAEQYFEHAISIQNKVLSQGDPFQARRQWIRIALACGCFFFDHGEKGKGRNLLEVAYYFAARLSKDQFLRVRAECMKRGIPTEGIGGC